MLLKEAKSILNKNGFKIILENLEQKEELLNKDAKEAAKIAKRNTRRAVLRMSKTLDAENRSNCTDNLGDKWLHYDGPVTEEILLKVFKDALDEGEEFLAYDEDEYTLEEYKQIKIKQFLDDWMPYARKLLNNEEITLYRGMSFNKCWKMYKSKYWKEFLVRNMQERNSWTYDKDVAREEQYQSNEVTVLLTMKCKLNQTNLVFSAWVNGYQNDNYAFESEGIKEINLKRMLEPMDVKVEIEEFDYDQGKMVSKTLEDY